MSEVDMGLAWRTALIVWAGILAVVGVSLYFIKKTIDSEHGHEFASDEESHLKQISEMKQEEN